MKMLMIYCDKFGYEPSEKTLKDFPDVHEGNSFADVLVGFIHAESQDEFDIKGVETKMIKNLKWAAKKNNTTRIILHSFSHLSDSKATPEFTRKLFNQAEARLNKADYEASQTPFGDFLTLDVQAPGYSQARIYKSFV
jgi:hypothetical protein